MINEKMTFGFVLSGRGSASLRSTVSAIFRFVGLPRRRRSPVPRLIGISRIRTS